jgi:phage tail-like protein
MKPVEFRRLLFRDDAHWEYGLSYRLRRLDAGGVGLFSRPAFTGWESRDPAALWASSLAVDDCGRLFWIRSQTGELYRRDPVNELVEPMVTLAEGDHRFGRMLTVSDRLWILDVTNSRLITIRPDTFQIIGEIPLNGAIDVAVDSGHLFTLDAEGIRAYDLDGRPHGGPYRGPVNPVALGAGRDSQGKRWIYVVDANARGFLRYSAVSGAFDSVIGSFVDVRRMAARDRASLKGCRAREPRGDEAAARAFTPRLLIVHPDGNLFVSEGPSAADASPVAHEFAPDGGYIGKVGEVSPLSATVGLAVDAHGELYVGSPKGIARFSREAGVAGNDGQFYTRTLDNGTDHDEGWHRVDLSAELDAGGALDVFYASANDAGLAGAVNGIFERTVSAFDKVEALEDVLGDLWKGPHELRAVVPRGAASAARSGFAGNMSHSVLFRPGTGRYLWLKLQLSGLAPKATASVREIRVYYPRLSYLRYLPAVYQQDKVSRELLERFLSTFETIFSGLEATIERIPEVFDPDLTPGEFLDWLAQWLDVVIEEDWPVDVKRRLIQRASQLYERKGTPGGLADFIEVVTGTRPIIRESFETERPFILGNQVFLGVDSRVTRPPMAEAGRDQRTVLGHASVLGTTSIRATTQVPVDPFRAAAHRFVVLLDLPPHRFRRYERGLHRIIRESAPAHVSYDIHLVSRALGGQTMLGINLKVADPQPLLLGYSALGGSICARRVWYGPQVGMDAMQAGPPHEANSAVALLDGEC